MESLKDFVKNIAYGIDGAEDDPKAALTTVGQYWKDFTAGWRRNHPAIPANTIHSIANVRPVCIPPIFFLSEDLILFSSSKAR